MTVDPNISSTEWDETLGALAHRYARSVCHYFRYHATEVASVDDLVAFICAQDERDDGPMNVRRHLNHATIPTLAEAGFVDYDARSDTVRYLEPEPVELWLDHVVEDGDIPV